MRDRTLGVEVYADTFRDRGLPSIAVRRSAALDARNEARTEERGSQPAMARHMRRDYGARAATLRAP